MIQVTQWKRGIAVLVFVSVLTVAVAPVVLGSEDVPQSLEEALHAAVDSWSQFATTGGLSPVATSFALDGPQFRQFEVEAGNDESRPNRGPLVMDIRDLRLRRLGSNTATVWTRIEVSRTGFVPEVFRWDFDLVNEDGRWLVWTVVPVEVPPTEAVIVETGPSTTVASPATTLAAASAAPEPAVGRLPDSERVESAPPSSLTGSTRGVRIPALSAWIIVITLVGVAAAGYMAPRIDRRRG